MRRTLGVWCLGGLATALATLGALAVLHPDPLRVLFVGPLLHFAAVGCSVTAARLRVGGWTAEHDTVLIAAAFIPLVGPSVAWLFLDRDGPCDAVNAHAQFERYETITAKNDGFRARSLPDDGEFEASQVYPMSLTEILRYGSMTQKRNALARLAEFGNPPHNRMLRKVMIVAEGELRLCAFVELSRAAARFEARIAESKAQLSEYGAALDQKRALLLTDLAAAHRDFAASELLDSDMAEYHIHQATQYIEEAWRVSSHDPRTVRVRALALSDGGDHAAALECLDRMSERDQSQVENRIARAEIAFRKRDFGVVRLQADRLRAVGVEPPDWLAAMLPDAEPAVDPDTAAAAETLAVDA